MDIFWNLTLWTNIASKWADDGRFKNFLIQPKPISFKHHQITAQSGFGKYGKKLIDC
jgi:hypothetical protein